MIGSARWSPSPAHAVGKPLRNSIPLAGNAIADSTWAARMASWISFTRISRKPRRSAARSANTSGDTSGITGSTSNFASMYCASASCWAASLFICLELLAGRVTVFHADHVHQSLYQTFLRQRPACARLLERHRQDQEFAGGEGVDHQDAERRRAIDQLLIVLAPLRRLRLELHHALAG